MAPRLLVPIALLAGGCTCAARHVGDAGAAVDGGRDAAVATDAGDDAGFDAWVPPDAEPVTNCFEAIRSFEGVPCTFDGACLAGDLCCSAAATCWSGRVSHAYEQTECEGTARPTGCAAQTGRVAGDTPLGAIDYGHAFVSFTFAFAVDAAILLTPDPDFAICAGDRFGIWLVPNADAGLTYVGTHDAVAQLVVGGALERAPAVVEITRYDGATAAAPNGAIAGTIRVEAPGWNVAGDFDAEGCDELDRTGP